MRFELLNQQHMFVTEIRLFLACVACPASGGLYLLLGFTGFACLYSCFYRSRLRAQYDLEEAPCVDCLVHFCCECCALSQEYRELRSRGFDMGIGMNHSIVHVLIRLLKP